MGSLDWEESVKARRSRGRLFCSFIPALVIALFVLGVGAVAAAEKSGSGATVNIQIGDDFFSPASATVNVGDTVVWTHTGAAGRPHDVTSDDGSINSPRRLMTGATYSFTATTPGVFNYHCTIHVNMDGVLTVLGAPAAPPATGAGGMIAAVMLQRQQLLMLAFVLVAGSATLAALRLRRG
jgi:plastocyanin